MYLDYVFFFQAEDGIRDKLVTGVQTCALPISRGLALAPADPWDEVENLATGDEREAGDAAEHARHELAHRAAPRRRDPPVVEAHREPLELDARARDRVGGGGQRAPRRDEAGGADPPVTEGETAAPDLQPVAPTVDDVVEGDPGPDVRQRAPREDRQAGPVARRQTLERRPHRRCQDRRLRRRHDRGQRPVVVEDGHQTGAARELALETREETGRHGQDALTPGVSTGIRESSLRRSPAQR